MRASRLIPAMLAIGILVAGAGVAEASHFRGGAIIPTVSASGELSITGTSFWRPAAVTGMTSFTVTGPGGFNQTSPFQSPPTAVDTSDTRFTKATNTATFTLPGAGLYSISADSCCRVAGIQNVGASSWEMNSKIWWDGSTANNPILFNFSAIQPEVVRGQAYSDNLGAVAGNGGTLSYNQALNSPIASQPPGFVIDPTTGALTISAANTATYLDNSATNVGADYAFSGNIFNTDGSSVEFDWLFDAVDTGPVVNLAPVVGDQNLNALIGSLLNINVLGTDTADSISDVVTLLFSSFTGPGGYPNNPTFNPGTPGASTTGILTWNTAGAAPGTYQAFIQGNDGNATDTGVVTINLSSANAVPLPSGAALGLALLGSLGIVGRIRRQRRC